MAYWPNFGTKDSIINAIQNNLRQTTNIAYVSNAELLNVELSQDWLRDPREITNWLPDSGASSHMTPYVKDLYDVEKLDYDCRVHLADEHIVNASC